MRSFGTRRGWRVSGVGAARRAVAASALAWMVVMPLVPLPVAAQQVAPQALPIMERHVEVSREDAAERPRGEGDQAIVEGWPLYRTERGQAAFNAAMATLSATDGAAPPAAAFRGCADLACNLSLPALADGGWLPPGRLWVSPREYVLFAHSPRIEGRRGYQRHGARSMRYFVLHEFHNGSRNVDPYDTISSHSSSVFVPFYMSKQQTDARGRKFVVVVQIAPHDVVSNHATNYGSAGPGIEVAKNVNEELEPLQASAGILVAAIVKEAVTHLRVVNHRGSEGLPMLEAWQERLAALRDRRDAPKVALPFVAAPARKIAAATGRLDELIFIPGKSKPIPIAERGIVPPRPTRTTAVRTESGDEPRLIEPIRPAVRPAFATSSGG